MRQRGGRALWLVLELILGLALAWSRGLAGCLDRAWRLSRSRTRCRDLDLMRDLGWRLGGGWGSLGRGGLDLVSCLNWRRP
jgi:hypothetical protein